MEIACVFSVDDYKAYAQLGPVIDGELAMGFKYSGSYCGRNIEKIYQKAVQHGRAPSLFEAVTTLQKASHVLIITGFFVLHQKGAEGPHGDLGGCETDGPLGALAVLRALCARGVRASLFCDVHNGPVIKKAYDSMMEHFREADEGFWSRLQSHSRCLPFVSAEKPLPEAAKAEVGDKEMSTLEERSWCLSARLGDALRDAWGDNAGRVDALLSLERLGAPYRNIRGRDIGQHTEPIDCLYPLVECGINEECRAALAEMPTAPFRRLAHVAEDAKTLGVGDGGNEVGMGRVVSVPGCSELRPDGAAFAPLASNGCVRSCDNAVLGTVSNWAGSAIEAACHVLWPAQVDYVPKMRSIGSSVEENLLRAIMAKPTVAVDGSHNDRAMSVDGMNFEPHHRELYDYLWHLAGVTAAATAKRPRIEV